MITNKNKLLVLFVWLFSFVIQAQAQQKYTISGTVHDRETGEELIGAMLLVSELQNVGAVSNEYGFYSLTLPQGQYTLKISYIGYTSVSQSVSLMQNQKLDINLSGVQELAEVVISAEQTDENVSRAQMGVEKLDTKDAGKLPVLFGERDVLKTIQLLPGVKSAGEGQSGFYVRGGTADQNLILLDEAPVYNASHLLGFFSTFNSDAIKDATLYKGNNPAQFGGRLASVLDIKMNEGNDKDYHVAGGLGLISSRLSVEGPIVKDRSSFLLTGRRTYADVFLKLTEDFKDNTLYFYDFNTKFNYRINDNNRLFLSGYFGRDILGLGEQFGFDWGNKTATLRWNSIIRPRLFSNTSFIYSDYNYNIKISGGNVKFTIGSDIQDWNLKQEFQFFPNTQSSWRWGFNTIHHTISPSRFESDNDTIVKSPVKDNRFGWENALFAHNSYTVNRNLNIEYGLRLSSYTILGGGKYNIYDKGVLTDSVILADGALGKTYINLEPRFTFSYKFNAVSSVKGGYSRNAQHLHLLSNSVSSSPTDQWTGNTYNVKPEVSDQISIGYFRNFDENRYEASIETYYKDMKNQVDYKNGADINTAPDVESELLYGKGRAYGIELLFKKKQGTFTGWISYTLARSERQIDGINDDKWYVAKQDRVHELSLVGMYQLTAKWSLSSSFVYYTGNAVTFPSGKYEINGNTIFLYTERNGYRMPHYHRLDFGANYEGNKRGRWHGSWHFGLYNVYGRENAYLIQFEQDEDDPSRTVAVQTSLFRWIPSITYNFKF